MYIKIHESYRKVVALCDKEILGKKFEEGKRQLDVRESFYKGDEVDLQNIVEKLKELRIDDATFNIVGEKAVGVAKEAGVIGNGNVGSVDGVPFALSLI